MGCGWFPAKIRNKISKSGQDHEGEQEPHSGTLPRCPSSVERLRCLVDVGVAPGVSGGCRRIHEDRLEEDKEEVLVQQRESIGGSC